MMLNYGLNTNMCGGSRHAVGSACAVITSLARCEWLALSTRDGGVKRINIMLGAHVLVKPTGQKMLAGYSDDTPPFLHGPVFLRTRTCNYVLGDGQNYGCMSWSSGRPGHATMILGGSTLCMSWFSGRPGHAINSGSGHALPQLAVGVCMSWFS